MSRRGSHSNKCASCGYQARKGQILKGNAEGNDKQIVIVFSFSLKKLFTLLVAIFWIPTVVEYWNIIEPVAWWFTLVLGIYGITKGFSRV